MKFMKKFMISSFLAITLLVSIAPAKTSFAASSNSCSKLKWIKNAYPDAYDYKFVNGDRPYVRVYPTKGSLDYFIVYCDALDNGHCMVCD